MEVVFQINCIEGAVGEYRFNNFVLCKTNEEEFPYFIKKVSRGEVIKTF